MSSRFRRLALRFLTPVVAVLIALLLTGDIQALHEKSSLFVFLAAVVVSTRIGGAAAGILATVLALAVTSWFFTRPIHSFSITHSTDVIRLLVFVAISLMIVSLYAARARAEIDLHRSEQRLILALDSAHMGVWDYNLLTREFWWSKTLELTYGRTNGSFPDTYGRFFALIHFDDQPLFNRAITRTIDEGTDYDVDHRIHVPDGSIRWINMRGRVFFNAAKRAERIVGVAADITTKKILERQQQSLDTGVALVPGGTS